MEEREAIEEEDMEKEAEKEIEQKWENRGGHSKNRERRG